MKAPNEFKDILPYFQKRLTPAAGWRAMIEGATIGIMLFMLSACAQYHLNKRLDTAVSAVDKKPIEAVSTGRPEEVILVLAFSGGGTRASALSYGILEALARVEIPNGTPSTSGSSTVGAHTLLDEVDVISGVSGGSFTAAYYGLYRKRIFEDFRERFLTRNVNRGLLLRMLSPLNWVRLLSSGFAKSDMAAEYYDEILFDGATFGDILKHKWPRIHIQATNIVDGFYFGFTEQQFKLICSDLAAFPVSRAVAASAAFPGVFTPIVLKNYFGLCDVPEPEWVIRTLAQGDVTSRAFHTAKQLHTYTDAEAKPFIYLIDGGVADNLGIRGPTEIISGRGDVRKTIRELDYGKEKKMAFVIVNAATKKSFKWERLGKIPGLIDIIGATSSTMIDSYNYETVELLRLFLRENLKKVKEAGVDRTQDVYIIEVGFDALTDKEERKYFSNIPTTLSLSDKTVDRLREVAGRILYGSKEFQKLVGDLGGQIPKAKP